MKHTKPMDETIRAAAAHWFAKRGDGAPEAGDEQAFEQWLEADPQHRLAYEQCAYLWLMASAVPADSLTAQPAKESAPEALLARRHLNWAPFAAAAAVLLCAVLLFNQPWQPKALRYETAVGEQKTVQLDDGSQLTLNTDTQVDVVYSEEQRSIRLRQGEAYFEVARNPQRPFVVDARGSQVRALGTAFNVALTPENIAVAVTEGVVAVSTKSADARPVEIATLQRGQGLRYTPTVTRAEPTEINLEKVTAWQARKIYFDNQRLADAIADYNRYTLQKVVLVDKQLEDQRISGVFNIGDTESLVFALEETFNARVVVKPHRVLVLRSRAL